MQVYVDGLGMMQNLPRFVAGLGVQASSSLHPCSGTFRSKREAL